MLPLVETETEQRAAKRQRSMRGDERVPGLGEVGTKESLKALEASDRGSRSARGAAAAPAGPEELQALGQRGLIDRTEFLRLLQQSLASLGYPEVAASLEQQSGVQCEDPQVVFLQAAVLAGNWAGAAACLDSIPMEHGPGAAQARARASLLLAECKYLEALHRGDVHSALACLRGELCRFAAACGGAGRLRELAGCLLCSPGELERHSAWSGSSSDSGSSGSGSGSGSGSIQTAEPMDGLEGEAGAAGGCSCSGGGCGPGGTHCAAALQLRRRALARLGAVLPPHVLLPPRRLETLVEQALEWQLTRCPLHNSPGAVPSLLADYSCGLEQVPTVTTQVLRDHGDEVWHLCFSPCGAMLATASKDGSVRVYDVRGRGAVAARHVLKGHLGPVAYLCWAPQGGLLASCGADRTVRVWDTAAGTCRAILTHHTDSVTSAAWLPDGETLVTGSHDKQMSMVNLEGRVLRRWPTSRVQDLLVAKGGRYLLATTSERRVRVYDLGAEGEGGGMHETALQERETIISMALSADSRYLLLNLTSQELHLWDLGPSPSELRLPSVPCAAYCPDPPLPHSRYVVRACLGGLDQRFVLTGSEEAKVHLYHRHTGALLASLEGHSGTVNAVSWNPADPHMFASASDDRTVRIWGLEAAVAARL